MTSDYYGLPVRVLASKYLELEVLETAGPRLVRLRYKGSANLLAELPQAAAPTPYGEYRFFGGHRLWHAPEDMPRSYLPDNEGLVITELPNGLVLDGKVEAGSAIHKQMEIQLKAERPEVVLTHTLINEGLWEIELAPWAISMFRLGGAAVLPYRSAGNPPGLLPNRRISLWPYSQIHDPRLQLEDEFALIKPVHQTPPFKIGVFNPRGWIAYWLDGILVRKSFAVHPAGRHVDFGCNAEIYCDGRVIELESLSPLVNLSPGQAVSWRETWQFYEQLEQDFLSEAMIAACRAAVP